MSNVLGGRKRLYLKTRSSIWIIWLFADMFAKDRFASQCSNEIQIDVKPIAKTTNRELSESIAFMHFTWNASPDIFLIRSNVKLLRKGIVKKFASQFSQCDTRIA